MEDYIVETTVASTDWSIMWWGIAIVVVLALLGYGIWRLRRLMERPETYGLTREEIAERWAMIRQTAGQNVMGAKVAIMEADTLLDSALKSLMMPGQTLGERLKVACYKYPKLRSVWWAHRMRNQLVHESGFKLSQRQAQQALDEYENAFKILNLM